MRYLVTGAGGFVMSMFIERLLVQEPGATVLGVDLHGGDEQLEVFFRAVRDRLRLATVDARDAAAIRDLMASYEPEVIVHGATLTHDPVSEREHPGRFLEVNVLGTVNLLDAARSSADLRKFLLISSAAAYGGNQRTALTEEDEAEPDELYGISKQCADQTALRYAELYGISLAIARLTKMFGPMERPTLGRSAMSLPYHLASAVVRGARVRMTERTWRAGGDWLHAGETAEALRLLLTEETHGIYNIGSGTRTSVADLAALFGEHLLTVAEPDVATVDMDPDSEYGKNGVIIPKRLRTEFGWRCAPLERQVADYLAWAEHNRGLFIR